MAITPYLLYQDAGAAVDWLGRAFGLRKTGDMFRDSSGRVLHAALTLGKDVVMLGSPGPEFRNPKVLGVATQNLYVDVDDVDRHYARAKKAGARIIEEPTDTFYGARRYGAEDPEGHQWYFAQELRDARRPNPSSKKKNPSAADTATGAKRTRAKRSSRK